MNLNFGRDSKFQSKSKSTIDRKNNWFKLKMRNGTQIIVASTNGLIPSAAAMVHGATSTTFAAIVGVLLWIYDLLIINPLRVFYFVGPVWNNMDPLEICYQETGRQLPAMWWAESPDRLKTCDDILNRKFTSWSTGVCEVIYFSFLTFVVLQLLFNCLYSGSYRRKAPIAPQPQ